MPFSYSTHISTVMRIVERLAPRAVLEVGIGFGKWGVLCREYLDVARERYERESWQTRIDGVEVYAGYRNRLHDWVYDQVFYADVRKILDELPPYDLVLLGDVIEHFTKEDGLDLLRAIQRKAGYALIATPVAFFQNVLYLDNAAELHLSHWSFEDFGPLGDFRYTIVGGGIQVVLLGGTGSCELFSSLPQRLFYRWAPFRRHPKAAEIFKLAVERFASREML